MTARNRLRRIANRLGAPLGVEVISTEMAQRQFRESQLGHLLLAMRHFAIELVVDVGANVGQFALELLDQGYAGQIVSVEPLPDAHAALLAAATRIDRWSVHDRVAFGPTEGTVTMQVAGNSVSSSVLPMLERHIQAAPGSRPVQTISVPQTTLDRAFASRVAASTALLKIDTQGYEQQVLAGGARCLDSAALVLLEMSVVPLYEGQWLCDEAMAFMRARGYVLWFQYPDFTDPATGRVLQYNGLFARA